MYIQPVTDRIPQGGAGPGLGGLGFWEALIPLAIAEINKPGGGAPGSAGMAPAGGTIQAQISSNVSPQISPVRADTSIRRRYKAAGTSWA